LGSVSTGTGVAPTGPGGSLGQSNQTSAFGNSSQSSFGSSSSPGGLGNSQAPPTGPGQPPAAPPDNSGAFSTPQPIAGDTDSPTIIGGNIIGVGSKINKRSIIWYDKARNYRQFEFIWDPAVDALTGQRLGAIPNNPNPFGNPSNGSSSNSPFSTGAPNQNPSPNPSPNPNPDPNSNPPLQAPPN
jgi:hypothetical protein